MQRGRLEFSGGPADSQASERFPLNLAYRYVDPARPSAKPRIAVRRNFSGWPGWVVFVDGFASHLCGENRARAYAVARDLRAGAPVVGFKMPKAKWR